MQVRNKLLCAILCTLYWAICCIQSLEETCSQSIVRSSLSAVQYSHFPIPSCMQYTRYMQYSIYIQYVQYSEK